MTLRTLGVDVLGDQDRLAGVRQRPVDAQRNRSPDHHLRELRRGRLGRRPGADGAAAVDDGHAVADGGHLA